MSHLLSYKILIYVDMIKLLSKSLTVLPRNYALIIQYDPSSSSWIRLLDRKLTVYARLENCAFGTLMSATWSGLCSCSQKTLHSNPGPGTYRNIRMTLLLWQAWGIGQESDYRDPIIPVTRQWVHELWRIDLFKMDPLTEQEAGKSDACAVVHPESL